ncbi:MAG: OB-fold domain-containing protein [Dehalococcoidia bacterium]|nr:OB-fold domain-containing protein [Dehalococcoidia bacterium]
MVGIRSYGAYVPLYRLERSEIVKAWRSPFPVPGEKAVANYDEDSLTMAFAAAWDCVRGIDRKEIDGVFFASTTSPYKEKQASTTIAGAMALRRDILAADFGGSLRAGTVALRAAIDAVKAGSARNILVTAADRRLAGANGLMEMFFGDGAAALLISKDDVAADLVGAYTISEDFFDMWRSDRDNFVRTYEERFIREQGYTRIIPEAVNGALNSCGLKPQDIARIALYTDDPRHINAAARILRFDPAQVQDPLFFSVGNSGTAMPLMLLVAALEDTKGGDNVMVGGYGDGCDALIFKLNQQIEKVRDRGGVKRHLASKVAMPNYQTYVLWRGLMYMEPQSRPARPTISLSALYRDRAWGLSLFGSKCTACGTPQYPVQRVCQVCQAVDQNEPYSFADRKGKLSSFSHDMLAITEVPPITVCAVDFEGGGRITCNMTDREPDQTSAGMDVEMTFRWMHYVEGVHSYWWKCRPVRF